MKTNFGDIMLFYRANNNMSQKEMAAALNMSQGMIAHYETGRHQPRLKTIKLFCKKFNVPIGSIIHTIS